MLDTKGHYVRLFMLDCDAWEFMRAEKYYGYFKNNQCLCVCCCGTWFFCEHRYLGCRVISQTIWDWDSL